MTDVTLVEGSLSFSFRHIIFAEKYDDWRHYRRQYNKTCGGSKAVDFLVVKPGEVWMIEVKDYRLQRRTKATDLADEVALKVRDTMAGLVSAKFLARDQSEASASSAALCATELRVALHLEQPRNPSRLFPVSVNPANIKLKLRQVLRFADCHTELFDCGSFPENLGTVSSI